MRMWILALMLASAGCGIAADITVDFNNPGDLNANFSGPSGGFVINETASGGLQGSRCVYIANADYSQIRIYKQQAFAGDTPAWRVGAFVNLVGNESSALSFGLVNSTAAFVNGGYNPDYAQPSPDWLSIGVSVSRLGTIHIYNNDQLAASSNIGALTPQNTAGWFFIEADGAASEGAYSLSARVFQADVQGNIGSQIGNTLTASGMANPSLMSNPSTYFFFGADGSANPPAHTLDNFEITVPEPNSVPIVATGLTLMLHRSRRQRRRLR